MTNKIRLRFINLVEVLQDIIIQNHNKELPLDEEDSERYKLTYNEIFSNEDMKNRLFITDLFASSLAESIIIYNNRTNKEETLKHAVKSITSENLQIIEHTIKHQLLSSSLVKKEENKKMAIKINKIKLSNFRFFIDDENNNTFEPNGQNMLIYGENGSGKSSLFKAFEFLASKSINKDKFNKNKNRFKEDEDTKLEFEFDNKKSLTISEDERSVDTQDYFITNLSVFMPMLNYQKLLEISYQVTHEDSEKNLFEFFEIILADYPLKDGKVLKDLKAKEDDNYFVELKRVIKEEVLDSTNNFLKQFNQGFELLDMEFSTAYKKVTFRIEYFSKSIKQYHNFLNEARLSALAISVYFSIIKKQFSLLENDALKILVLDDLLISLDMNNRLSLIKILQEEFSDYQIFFFTHEKALFDLFKEKMKFKSYEIYVAKNDDYEVPFIKESNSLLEQAIQQIYTQHYGCSANLLRQSTEELLCKYLKDELTIGDKCKVLELDKLLNRAIKSERTKAETDSIILESFEKLKTFKRVLLNDASHYNGTNIYKRELEETIDVLEQLISKLN